VDLFIFAHTATMPSGRKARKRLCFSNDDYRQWRSVAVEFLGGQGRHTVDSLYEHIAARGGPRRSTLKRWWNITASNIRDDMEALLPQTKPCGVTSGPDNDDSVILKVSHMETLPR